MIVNEPTTLLKNNRKIAVYPGTFDPITNGHLDIITRALHLVDRLIIVIAVNVGKKPMFSLEDRLTMIKRCFPAHEDRIEVDFCEGLLVDYAAGKEASIIIRGLRAVSDFDYEFQLALMNRWLQKGIETVFLMTGFRWIYISSSIIKEAAINGGDVKGLVPDHIYEKLKEKYLEKISPDRD